MPRRKDWLNWRAGGARSSTIVSASSATINHLNSGFRLASCSGETLAVDETRDRTVHLPERTTFAVACSNRVDFPSPPAARIRCKDRATSSLFASFVRLSLRSQTTCLLGIADEIAWGQLGTAPSK